MPCHLDQLKILKTITTSMFLLSMSIASIARITMCCQHNIKVPSNYLIRKNQTFKQLNDTKTRLFDTNFFFFGGEKENWSTGWREKERARS
jgi:hypothetical protein